MNDKRFRTAYVTQKGHNMSAVHRYAENIVFLSFGYEGVQEFSEAIWKDLVNFDPSLDVIIPVGKVAYSLATGIEISRVFGNDKVNIGIYSEGDYEFVKI